MDYRTFVSRCVVPTIVAIVVAIVVICIYKTLKWLGLGELVWPIIVALVPVLVTQGYTKTIRDAEIRVKYIQIAVGILSSGPSDKELHSQVAMRK